MALGKSRLKIAVKGGGTLQIRELYPTPTNSYSDLGYVENDIVLEESDVIDSVDETGLVIQSQSGNKKLTWKSTLLQTGIDEINLLRNADGKYYDLYYSVLLPNGNTQEFRVWLCKLKPNLNLEFSSGATRKIEVEFTALAPKANFTATPTDYNVVAGKYYVVIENATAKGAPTDTASSMANAIL